MLNSFKNKIKQNMENGNLNIRDYAVYYIV